MDFGEVRSIAQRPPDAASWRDLCRALSAFSPDALAREILPYLEGTLREWPHALRIAPASWVRRSLSGEPVPQMALSRTIALDLDPEGPTGQLLARDARIEYIARSPELEPATKLVVRGVTPEHHELIAALRIGMPHATTLRLVKRPSGRALPLGSWRKAGVFDGLEHLDLSPLDKVASRELIALLTAPGWGLKSLDISRGMHYPRAEQLAAATMLPKLEAWVGVGVGSVSDPVALRTLRTTKWFSKLSRFGASTHNAVDARAFASSSHIARLKALELTGSGILDAFVEQLSERDDLSLEHLALQSNELGPKSVQALSSSALMPELRHLALRGSFALGRVGRLAHALERAERLSALTLRGISIDPDGLRRILSGPWMRRLRELELSSFDIGKTGLEVVVTALGIEPVESLNLMGCRLDDIKIRTLMVPGALAGLRVLDVRRNPRLTKVEELASALPHVLVRT